MPRTRFPYADLPPELVGEIASRVNNRTLVALAGARRNNIVNEALRKRKRSTMAQEARALLDVLVRAMKGRANVHSVGAEKGFVVEDSLVEGATLVTSVRGRHYEAEMVSGIAWIRARRSTTTLATVAASGDTLVFFSGRVGEPRRGAAWEALKRAAKATNALKLGW